MEGRRRSATRAVRGPNRGLKAATGRASLRDERRWTSVRSAKWRNCAVDSHRAGNRPRAGGGHALKESPDYELHRLTTQTPAFFDETVRRQVEKLKKELATLKSEAEELAKEIEELTGEVVPRIE